MYKNNVIHCPRCRITSSFPLRYDVERAIKVLTVNYTLLDIATGCKERIPEEDAKYEDTDEYFFLNNISRIK